MKNSEMAYPEYMYKSASGFDWSAEEEDIPYSPIETDESDSAVTHEAPESPQSGVETSVPFDAPEYSIEIQAAVDELGPFDQPTDEIPDPSSPACIRVPIPEEKVPILFEPYQDVIGTIDRHPHVYPADWFQKYFLPQIVDHKLKPRSIFYRGHGYVGYRSLRLAGLRYRFPNGTSKLNPAGTTIPAWTGPYPYYEHVDIAPEVGYPPIDELNWRWETAREKYRQHRAQLERDNSDETAQPLQNVDIQELNTEGSNVTEFGTSYRAHDRSTDFNQYQFLKDAVTPPVSRGSRVPSLGSENDVHDREYALQAARPDAPTPDSAFQAAYTSEREEAPSDDNIDDIFGGICQISPGSTQKELPSETGELPSNDATDSPHLTRSESPDTDVSSPGPASPVSDSAVLVSTESSMTSLSDEGEAKDDSHAIASDYLLERPVIETNVDHPENSPEDTGNIDVGVNSGSEDSQNRSTALTHQSFQNDVDRSDPQVPKKSRANFVEAKIYRKMKDYINSWRDMMPIDNIFQEFAFYYGLSYTGKARKYLSKKEKFLTFWANDSSLLTNERDFEDFFGRCPIKFQTTKEALVVKEVAVVEEVSDTVTNDASAMVAHAGNHVINSLNAAEEAEILNEASDALAPANEPNERSVENPQESSVPNVEKHTEATYEASKVEVDQSTGPDSPHVVDHSNNNSDQANVITEELPTPIIDQDSIEANVSDVSIDGNDEISTGAIVTTEQTGNLSQDAAVISLPANVEDHNGNDASIDRETLAIARAGKSAKKTEANNLFQSQFLKSWEKYCSIANCLQDLAYWTDPAMIRAVSTQSVAIRKHIPRTFLDLKKPKALSVAFLKEISVENVRELHLFADVFTLFRVGHLSAYINIANLNVFNGSGTVLSHSMEIGYPRSAWQLSTTTAQGFRTPFIRIMLKDIVHSRQSLTVFISIRLGLTGERLNFSIVISRGTNITASALTSSFGDVTSAITSISRNSAPLRIAFNSSMGNATHDLNTLFRLSEANPVLSMLRAVSEINPQSSNVIQLLSESVSNNRGAAHAEPFVALRTTARSVSTARRCGLLSTEDMPFSTLAALPMINIEGFMPVEVSRHSTALYTTIGEGSVEAESDGVVDVPTIDVSSEQAAEQDESLQEQDQPDLDNVTDTFALTEDAIMDLSPFWDLVEGGSNLEDSSEIRSQTTDAEGNLDSLTIGGVSVEDVRDVERMSIHSIARTPSLTYSSSARSSPANSIENSTTVENTEEILTSITSPSSASAALAIQGAPDPNLNSSPGSVLTSLSLDNIEVELVHKAFEDVHDATPTSYVTASTIRRRAELESTLQSDWSPISKVLKRIKKHPKVEVLFSVEKESTDADNEITDQMEMSSSSLQEDDSDTGSITHEVIEPDDIENVAPVWRRPLPLLPDYTMGLSEDDDVSEISSDISGEYCIDPTPPRRSIREMSIGSRIPVPVRRVTLPVILSEKHANHALPRRNITVSGTVGLPAEASGTSSEAFQNRIQTMKANAERMKARVQLLRQKHEVHDTLENSVNGTDTVTDLEFKKDDSVSINTDAGTTDDIAITADVEETHTSIATVEHHSVDACTQDSDEVKEKCKVEAMGDGNGHEVENAKHFEGPVTSKLPLKEESSSGLPNESSCFGISEKVKNFLNENKAIILTGLVGVVAVGAVVRRLKK